MSLCKYRSLVVDDEEAILKLVQLELQAQGFTCDTALDGNEALQQLKALRYDIVITDLRMPNLNGHALAHKILELQERPLIVIHTGIVDSRLSKDLLSLGVDDIIYKPVEAGVLALKIKSMVERGKRIETTESDADTDQSATLSRTGSGITSQVSFARLNSKIMTVARLLPMSQTTFDVYEMTRSLDWDLTQIAAAIQRDGALAAEVLRLANSATYNPSNHRITQLEDAVGRIGQKRVGELALSASALSALAPGMLPWMDLELAWKRSMAAGIALEMLIELGGHQKLDDGLMLSAILHPLGRMVLGMLFPKYYEAIVGDCTNTGETLRQQERRIFPIHHTEIMGHLLASWRIPAELVVPLKFSMDDFSATAGLSEPTRTKVEVVKVAIILGRLAVDGWESWDFVQFPSHGILRRLGIREARRVITQTRLDVDKLAQFRPGTPYVRHLTDDADKVRPIAYINLSPGEDLLIELLPAIGLVPSDAAWATLEPAIANCLGADPERLTTLRQRKNVIAITDQDNYDRVRQYGPAIVLPNSFGRLRDHIFRQLGKPTESTVERARSHSLQ